MTTQTEGNTPVEDELIPVDAPVEDEKPDDTADDADDEDDSGDERLAESDDDHDDDVTAANRNRRKKRREQQRKARERTEAELEFLRQQVSELTRRQASVEGHTIRTVAQNVDQQLAQTLGEIQQAERIFAKATEAGNGEDAMAALQIRDEARARAAQLHGQREQFNRTSAQPQVDPAVTRYSQAWLAANPWYNPAGNDRDSATAKAVDAQLAREGKNPATREYWEELTNRLADAFGDDEAPARAEAKPKRRAPPHGGTREHVPPSTRKEIYVTPERKQAMIEAGAWDDPVMRQKMLKAYRDYDQQTAR